jgi:hypothetical protein
MGPSVGRDVVFNRVVLFALGGVLDSSFAGDRAVTLLAGHAIPKGRIHNIQRSMAESTFCFLLGRSGSSSASDG